MVLGMPYVEFDVPPGTAERHRALLPRDISAPAGWRGRQRPVRARRAGADQHLIFRETDAAAPAFDGHHVAI